MAKIAQKPISHKIRFSGCVNHMIKYPVNIEENNDYAGKPGNHAPNEVPAKGLKAVSYTHLDVYKRQGKDHVYYDMNKAASKVAALPTNGMYAYHGLINLTDNYVVQLGKNKPVSYTHLELF